MTGLMRNIGRGSLNGFVVNRLVDCFDNRDDDFFDLLVGNALDVDDRVC